MDGRIGPYRVEGEIGRGGMGVVYRAVDERLDRVVAIKALPDEVSGDTERLARLEVEARTMASLNHPSIAGIYGVEERDGRRYLILEYVEGETLADRLERGSLAVDEAVEICRQVASGVAAAHEAGVVHRDLKPANIKLTPGGRVKVLDFGLAKSVGASSMRGLAESPTAMELSPTIPGVILGTAAYMSPEQARGRAVDKRTDIWSFGVVLYECLAGIGPFQGETATDSIGAILHKEIGLDGLPAETPPMVRHVLRRCLERDRERRYRDIGDVGLELASAMEEGTSPAEAGEVAPAARGGRWWVVAVALVLAALAGGLFAGRELSAPSAPARLVASITAPEGTAFHLNGSDPGVPQVSPDGRWLVFVGRDEDQVRRLWVRSMATGEATALQGTESARYPFWAPDSRRIGYFDGESLRIVEVQGGPSRRLADAPNGKGASWSRDGRIVFAPTPVSGLSLVSEDGGPVRELTALEAREGIASHRHPCFLPDGRRFLYAARPQNVSEGGELEIRVGSIDGSAPVELMRAESNAVYASGWVFFAFRGELRARPFDAGSLAFTGPAVTIGSVLQLEGASLAVVAASESGDLTYVSRPYTPHRFRLVWRSRDGDEAEEIGRDLNIGSVRLFDGGARFVAPVASAGSTGSGLFAGDATTGTLMRLTTESGAFSTPAVSSDGGSFAYALTLDRGCVVSVLSARGVEAPREIATFETGRFVPMSWSPDGDEVVGLGFLGPFGEEGSIVAVRTDGSGEWREIGVDGSPVDTLRISPDGEWLAYVMDAGGPFQVFVRAWGEESRDILISPDGGRSPAWRSDSREIYYHGDDGVLHAVSFEVDGSGEVRVEAPEALFDLGEAPSAESTGYDAAPDGERFLVRESQAEHREDVVTLVRGWPEMLRDR